MREQVLMSWSGGKDSAAALDELMRDERYEVVGLLTSVAEEFRRVSHHGVREELLDDQADAIGLPLEKVYLPTAGGRACSNSVYEAIMSAVMEKYKARGVETVAFGDLFLEDLRAYREANLAGIGMRGIFPVWKRGTVQFARTVIERGFKAYLSCVEGNVGAGFVGRPYDERLVADLPPGIDPCGENGEFHSFVWNGPIFKRPVAVTIGETVVRDGRYYADLLLAGRSASQRGSVRPMPPV